MAEVKLVIRVHFVDDSFKTLAVNSTITGAELCELIAEKIELEDNKSHFCQESFALFFYKGGECRCVEDEEQVCRLMVHETMADVNNNNDLFSQYISDRVQWEKLKKDWDKDSKLVYKKRVFLRHRVIPKELTQFINYSYIQAVSDVRNGTYPCSKENALELAGVQMQGDFGDYNAKLHVPGFIVEKDKIGNLIPSPLLKTESGMKPEDWEKEIFVEHAKLTGLSREEAKIAYLQSVRSWNFYGGTFWNVVNASLDVWPSVIPDSVCLCVNSTGIELLRVGTKERIYLFDYRDIRGWSYSRSCFSFVSSLVGDKKFQFNTVHAKDIVKTISTYIDILTKEKLNGAAKY